ncbi:MAG: stage II sporulation protein M [Deltaproteobacteria bacterium]|nr:stage II sporulation protein M [Deltaproteobacteria bacterium]
MVERTMKPYILVLALIFTVSFLAGTMAPPAIRRQMTEVFQSVVGNYGGLAGGMLFFNILVQNVMATIFVIISGVIVGIIPTFAISSNGFGLGVLYRQAADASSYSKAALKVLPYGVFEIPALLIAASYGLWLGVAVVRRMRGKESITLGSGIEHAFRRYFAVVFPLLVVAAAIETSLILWLP